MRTLNQLWNIYLQNEVPSTRWRNGRLIPNHTFRDKARDWELWCEYLASTPNKPPWCVNLWTRAHAIGFRDTRLQVDAASTISRRISTLKTFGTRLQSTIGIVNPWPSVSVPRTPLPPVRSITALEWDRAYDAAKQIGKNEFLRSRNGLYVLALRESGLRPFELLELRLSQFDYGSRVIRDIEIKANAQRITKPITERIRLPIAKYIGERERTMDRLFRRHDYPWRVATVAERNRYPLFISTYNATPGDPNTFFLSYKQIQRLFRDIRKRTGLDLRAYDLRHDFGRRFYLHTGNDITQTAQALGHTSTQCTFRYARAPETEVHETTRSLSDELSTNFSLPNDDGER